MEFAVSLLRLLGGLSRFGGRVGQRLHPHSRGGQRSRGSPEDGQRPEHRLEGARQRAEGVPFPKLRERSLFVIRPQRWTELADSQSIFNLRIRNLLV